MGKPGILTDKGRKTMFFRFDKMDGKTQPGFMEIILKNNKVKTFTNVKN